MSRYRDHGELLQGRIQQRPVDNFFYPESSPRMLPKRHGEGLKGLMLGESWIALIVFLKTENRTGHRARQRMRVMLRLFGKVNLHFSPKVRAMP